MQHIYIVRHGTTDWVDEKKIQGDTDIPLNQKGRMQAEKAARALAPIQFDAVYCSPLSRTRETAEIICKSKERQPEVIEDLREMNFGWFEGTHDYTKQTDRITFLDKIRFSFRTLLIQISGESFAAVRERGFRDWELIDRKSPEGTILIVAHGMILNPLVEAIIGEERYNAIRPLKLHPCSISELTRSGQGNTEIIRMDDTAHLA